MLCSIVPSGTAPSPVTPGGAPLPQRVGWVPMPTGGIQHNFIFKEIPCHHGCQAAPPKSSTVMVISSFVRLEPSALII